MSAGMIIGSFYLVPRIGIGAFFVLLVAGKLLAAMVFGQFGLFGAPATAMTPRQGCWRSFGRGGRLAGDLPLTPYPSHRIALVFAT